MKRIITYAFLLVTLFIHPVGAQDVPRYDIDIKFDYERSELKGLARIDFENKSSKATGEVYLLLYPNSQSEESPYLNDVNYEWVYPGNFDPASMEIESVKGPSSDLKFEYEEGMDKNKTLLKVFLIPELKSSERMHLEILYKVKIPRKFGPFGQYRKNILLNGGFYPYLVPLDDKGNRLYSSYPRKADFNLEVYGEGSFFVNGDFAGNVISGGFGVELKNRNYISLYNTRGKEATLKVEGDNVAVDLTTFTDKSTVQKHMLKNIKLFVDFVDSREEFRGPTTRFSVMESYLRDRLIQPSDHVLYVSDRAFKVFPALRNYHAITIIRGLFYQLILERIGQREATTYDWVAATLSWHYTEQFIKYHMSKIKRDARKLSLVRGFSFLPQLDQVIYAPQFSFTSAFYDQIYSWDLFRLDILDFNNDIRSKRVVYEKIKDKYSRERDMDELYKAYIKGDEPFSSFMALNLGKQALKIFDAWLGPYPKVNYNLVDIKRKKRKEGGYENRILLKKETLGEIETEDEVSVFAGEWGGKKHLLKWDVEHARELDLNTEKRLRTVQIDPAGRLYEYKLGDNRSPALYKWVLTSSAFGIDLNELSPTFSFTTQFRRIFGSNNRYNMGGYRDSASFGANVGYTRLFGRLLDSLRLSHGVALSYRIDGLANDYLVYVPGIEDPSSQEQIITINESGISTSLLFQYFFGSQFSYTNPKEGMGATFFAEVAGKYLGGEFNFYKAGLNMSGILPFDQSNFLAWRFAFGVSGNDGIPAQRQYYLGGINNMRGFAFGELGRIGRNRILFGGEYRHYLLKDIDINIFSIFRVRNIMGGLFMNAGRVSATVEEYSLSMARGISFHKSPHHLFNIKMYDADFGYGIKFLHHMLGVKEAVFAVDVAKSITDFRKNGVRYYITFNHYF